MLSPNVSLEDLVPELRARFPSLLRTMPDGDQAVVYLDGPSGSQVPETVVAAIVEQYTRQNSNTGGHFITSRETGQMMASAHQAAADWFNATDPRECIFGANMTTMTFAFSRAMAREWRPGERVVVTELDHDANVTPWKLAAKDAGIEVETVRIHPEDATLDQDDFRAKVRPGTRLVAMTCASNSVGSKTDVASLIEHAHSVGAEVYLDAVHYAPHSLIDVKKWDADFCVCSAYKFFGPHVGLLWGRLSRLEELTAYKLRPAPDLPPGKWMTGTQNFAAISGAMAAIDYVASIGYRLGASPLGAQFDPTQGASSGSNRAESPVRSQPVGSSRRAALELAFTAIERYERELARRLLKGLAEIKSVTTFGITAVERAHERVPTVACNMAGWTSQQVAERLGHQGIFCWHGDYYAVDLCAALGQQPHGMIRLGMLHINTAEEIDRLLAAIADLRH